MIVVQQLFEKQKRVRSLRFAKVTSLGRAMGFKQAVVQKFSENIPEIFEKDKLRPEQIKI